MVADHRFARIDTPKLKELIFRKIGPQRAEKYIDQLDRFFAMKLSIAEFNKNCLQLIGRENPPLHNQFIFSILQNSCRANVPPRNPQKPNKLALEFENGCQRNRRSPIIRARKSPLGPLGKSPSLTWEETFSIGSQPPVIEEGEEVEQSNKSLHFQRWNPITAPIGISVNSCRARKGFGDLQEACENSRVLPDTRYLRRRLQQKLSVEGVEISLECVELLNNGLDVFLKKLIEPCVGIAGSRRTNSCIIRAQYGHRLNCNNQMLPRKFASKIE